MRRAAGGLVPGLVVVLAGCGTASSGDGSAVSSSFPSDSPSAPAAALPGVPGVSAEAVLQRTDVVIGGQVQVRIGDTGTEPFTVTSVALDSPGFARLPAREVSATFRPGQEIDLPTRFGAVDCSVGVDPVAARITLVRPDGSVEQLRVPVTGGTMAQIHARACAVEELLGVLDLTVEDLAGEGDTLTADVVLTRRSGRDEFVVSALLQSVVLAPEPDRELPVRLAPGERQLRLPVTFDAARCDPHALAEVKQPFLFTLVVAVGDAERVAVPLPLDDAQEAQLQEYLRRACR